MRTTVPTLLLLAGALAAMDDSPERAIRQQESAQRGVSSTATQTAQHADLLADQLRFNRVGDESDAASIDKLGSDLSSLVEAKGDGKTMAWVEDRLSHARRSGDQGDLAAASQGQGELVGKLDELAKKAQSKGADGVSALRAAIDAQQRLQDETAKQSDQTLGKERSELSTQEKADLEKLARQERNMEQAVKDTAQALKDQAKAATDPQEKQNLENAAKQLEQSQAQQQAKSAADKLADNRLAEAQDKQQQVLDALQQADRAVAGMQQNDMAALDKQMQQMQQLEQQQQSLLNQMQQQNQQKQQNQMSQADWNKMQAEQQDIAKGLQEMQQDKAQGEAQKAEQDLQKQDGKDATKDMQAALDAMKQAQAAMQQKMQQMAQAKSQQPPMPGPPMPGPPQKPQPDSKEAAQKAGDQSDLEDGAHQGKAKTGWKVALAPQEREVLTQASADKFPARYEQALVQYYQALAGEGGDK